MGDNCVLGAKNEQRIISLEKRIGSVEKAVIDIRDRLLGRPSWAVMLIITMLSSISVGLIVKVIMTG